MNYWKIIDAIDYRLEYRNGGDRYHWDEVDRMEKIRDKAVKMLNRKCRLSNMRELLKFELEPDFRARVDDAIANYDNWSESKQFEEPLFIAKHAERDYGIKVGRC